MSRRLLILLCVGSLFLSAVLWIKSSRLPLPPLLNAEPHFFALTGQVPNSKKIEVFNAWGIGISPDGRTLAVWEPCPDPRFAGTMYRFWDVPTKQPLNFTTPRGEFAQKEKGCDVHQTPEGFKGILNEDGFSLQNVATGRVVRRFNKPTSISLYELAWTLSPDGKRLWWADSQRIFWQSIE